MARRDFTSYTGKTDRRRADRQVNARLSTLRGYRVEDMLEDDIDFEMETVDRYRAGLPRHFYVEHSND